MKTLVLRKRTWWRGKGPGGSCLRGESGQKCCLGFLATACGIGRITGYAMPSDVRSFKWPQGLLVDHGPDVEGRPVRSDTKLGQKIARVNDEDTLDDATRVRRLRPLFRKLGFRLVVKP